MLEQEGTKKIGTSATYPHPQLPQNAGICSGPSEGQAPLSDFAPYIGTEDIPTPGYPRGKVLVCKPDLTHDKRKCSSICTGNKPFHTGLGDSHITMLPNPLSELQNHQRGTNVLPGRPTGGVDMEGPCTTCWSPPRT